jgi:hypothetical protein
MWGRVNFGWKASGMFYNYQFILLAFLFRGCCMHRKFELQDLWNCALLWWCQKHHLTSHTQHTFSTLYKQLFSSHNPVFTRDTVVNQERPTFVEFCSSIPTCVIVSSIFFHDGESRISTLYFLSLSRKE